MHRIALVVLGALAFPLASNAQRLTTPKTTAITAEEVYVGRGVLEGIQLTSAQKSALADAIADFSSAVVKTFGQPSMQRPLSEADSKRLAALRDGLTLNIRKILTSSQQSRFDSNLNALGARRNPG